MGHARRLDMFDAEKKKVCDMNLVYWMKCSVLNVTRDETQKCSVQAAPWCVTEHLVEMEQYPIISKTD